MGPRNKNVGSEIISGGRHGTTEGHEAADNTLNCSADEMDGQVRCVSFHKAAINALCPPTTPCPQPKNRRPMAAASGAAVRSTVLTQSRRLPGLFGGTLDPSLSSTLFVAAYCDSLCLSY